ncbi:MAG TPA: DUF1552 domain-containing protein [Lacipirellulaceae bacterium]|jgi:hypothetical protein|nr:DUF1552 domain-containing protein [Lacipirellulaceae bacterium]
MATNLPSDGQRAAERHSSLSRRHFLRGVGATIALPALPSLVPRWSRAAEVAIVAKEAVAAAAAPQRMVFLTIPNGVHQENWWPTGKGKDFELGPTMEPLASMKGQIQVIGGLDHINATAGKDGAGDHARASASLLTGCRAKKTNGSDIYLGPSVDQVAAQHIGHLTRFPSLELTCDAVRNSGNCDSGYSCAYQFNIAWRSATTPVPPEPNPRLVFERLFGSGSPEERRKSRALRQQSDRSILDFIRDDARSLTQKLDAKDGRKLDEYLTSIREIEQRLARFAEFGELPNPKVEAPEGVPDPFEERMQVMYDMIALAFETDSTRIATLILAHDGSNRPFPAIEVKRGHHDLSHHQGNEDNLAQIAKIDRHYVSYFAKFLEKLSSMKDADGTSVLHNSMIVYACGNGDGNRHSHDNLPVILAGAGGGGLTPGRFHEVDSMPMSNMYIEMLEHMGVRGIDRFGDSDGRRPAV